MSSLSVRRRINMDAAATPGSASSMQMAVASPMKQSGKRQIGTVNERVETAGDFDSPQWQPGKLQKLEPVPALNGSGCDTTDAKLNFLHSALVDRFATVDKHLETLCNLTNVLGHNLDTVKADTNDVKERLGEFHHVEVANWRALVETEINTNRASTESWIQALGGSLETVTAFTGMISDHKNWAHSMIDAKFAELQERTQRTEQDLVETKASVARVDTQRHSLAQTVDAHLANHPGVQVKGGIEIFGGKAQGPGGDDSQTPSAPHAQRATGGPCAGHCGHVDELLDTAKTLEQRAANTEARLTSLETKAVDGNTKLTDT